MATIQFRIRSKANKNVSIKARLSIDRSNVFELNTGFTINPKDWSESNNLPKQNSETNKKIFSDLRKLDSFIIDSLNTDLGKSILIDSNWLQSKINDCFNRVTKTNSSLLINHIQYIIDNANTRQVKNRIGLSKSTIKNYNLFKNIILEYQKKIKKQIQFIELTQSFIDKFKNWLINTKNYSINYAGKQLEIMKTVCIDAEKNEIQVTPYSKIIKHFRESDDDRYIQTLSFEELESIKNVDLSNIDQLKEFKVQNPELTKKLSITPKNLNNARNWILLGCEIGQRGGDLLKITRENIRYNGKSYYIDLVQEKTNKKVTIGVIASHIIDILENQFPQPMQDQKLNEYSKVICKLAGIIKVVEGKKLDIETNRKKLGRYPKYELISTHSYRRSFCSNYYKKIPTPVLMGISGHSKESIFLQYINQREDKDSNADLFMRFYEDLHKDKAPTIKVLKNGTEN